MDVIVKLSTGCSLPCGVLLTDGTDADLCGRPASVLNCIQAVNLPGYRWRGLPPGEWICLPVCAEHARAMHAVYKLAPTGQGD